VCSSDLDHVLIGERQRDHAALDRAGFCPAEVPDATEQPRVEVQTIEGKRRRVERLRLVCQHRRLGLDVNRLVSTLVAS